MDTKLLIYIVSGLNICIGLSVVAYCCCKKNTEIQIAPELVKTITEEIYTEYVDDYNEEEINGRLEMVSFNYTDVEETDL